MAPLREVLRFEPVTPQELADPLVREALEIPEAIRLVVAVALRAELGLGRRLGAWVVDRIGAVLGLEHGERRIACALTGYLARYDGPDRISSYADLLTGGFVLPSFFEGLTPGEAAAIALHRELDRQLRT